MISSLDKAILGTVGAILAGITGSASVFAWKMTHSDGALGLSPPGAVVAELSSYDGAVKTRHRETLAWRDADNRQPLREGDRIRTLGSAHAVVLYAEGLEVDLEADSQITVHGPTKTAGETLVASIDVVDGYIRAKVGTGAVALRDASGIEQGRLHAESGNAEVALHASDSADGAIGLKVLEGTAVAVRAPDPRDTAATPSSEPLRFGRGEESSLGFEIPMPTAAPTPTLIARVVPTPVPPLEPGPELPIIMSEGSDTRFRKPIPAGVVAVTVRGKAAVLHDDGMFEIELFGLPAGLNSVDLEYRHADGSYTRQVQRIRVR
jgi:hypothetical protein